MPKNLKEPRAVDTGGLINEYDPDGLFSPEICLEAAHKYYDALGFIPDEFITAGLCRIAIESAKPAAIRKVNAGALE
ncbi:MAG: hypothetical protein LBU19_11180 [Treponema sp.]|nr:hypothetical protein [Treponema sp.]